jgi:hypothetical protein
MKPGKDRELKGEPVSKLKKSIVEYDGKKYTIEDLKESGCKDGCCDAPERYKILIRELGITIERNEHKDPNFHCSKCGPLEQTEEDRNLPAVYQTPEQEGPGIKPFLHICPHVAIPEDGVWYDFEENPS